MLSKLNENHVTIIHDHVTIDNDHVTTVFKKQQGRPKRRNNCKYFMNFAKIMDTIKDYVSPKRFSILAYVCVILHFHCGVILTAITTGLSLNL